MMSLTTASPTLHPLNYQSTTPTSIDDMISIDVDNEEEDDEDDSNSQGDEDENEYYNDIPFREHEEGTENSNLEKGINKEQSTRGSENNDKHMFGGGTTPSSLYSIGGFLPLLKNIQETLSLSSSSSSRGGSGSSSGAGTHHNTKNNNKKQTTSSKIQLLEQIEDELLTNIS